MTVALGNNPGGATLGGTLTAPVVDGVATFSDLTLSQPGTGYTLTVTVSGTSIAQTTTPITVTRGPEHHPGRRDGRRPRTATFGQPVTLTATVSVVSPGTGVPTGTVTFEEGSTILGTVNLTDGVASLTTTPAAAGTRRSRSPMAATPTTSPAAPTFPLTVDQATPTLTWADPAGIPPALR